MLFLVLGEENAEIASANVDPLVLGIQKVQLCPVLLRSQQVMGVARICVVAAECLALLLELGLQSNELLQ